MKEKPGSLVEEILARPGKRNEIYMTNACYHTSRDSVYLGKIKKHLEEISIKGDGSDLNIYGIISFKY